MKGKDILLSLQGLDEFGDVKTYCSISLCNVKNEDEVEDTVLTGEAEIQFGLWDAFFVIDIKFGNPYVYDYLQMVELCRKCDELNRTTDKEEKGGYFLLMSMAPKGEYDCSMYGAPGIWSILPDESGIQCSGIRMIFERDKVGLLLLQEDGLCDLINEVIEELSK